MKTIRVSPKGFFMKLLTRDEVALIIGCSKRHVSDLSAEGVLPTTRIGGLLRFPADAVAELIRASTSTVATSPTKEKADV
jgi:excisionase family DNA binding protein